MYMCVWGINVTSLSTISDSDGLVINKEDIKCHAHDTCSIFFFYFFFAFHFIKIIKTAIYKANGYSIEFSVYFVLSLRLNYVLF
jgi:hypothetical protein